MQKAENAIMRGRQKREAKAKRGRGGSSEGARAGGTRRSTVAEDWPQTSYVAETQRLLRKLVSVQDAKKTKAMRTGRVRASSRGPALRFTAEWEGTAWAGTRIMERRPSVRVERERAIVVSKREAARGGRPRVEGWKGKDIRIREQYLSLLRENLEQKLGADVPQNRGRSQSIALAELKLLWGDVRKAMKKQGRSRSVDHVWEREKEGMAEDTAAAAAVAAAAADQDESEQAPINEPQETQEHLPERTAAPLESPLARGSPLAVSPLAGFEKQPEITSEHLMELVASVAATISLREAGVTKGDKIVMDLSRRQLSHVPVEAYLLVPPISDLILAKNTLQSLPVELDRWSSLVKLRVDGNSLESLPEGLGVCCKLVELNCSGNRLASLPAAFTSLTSLATLLLSGNCFERLPPSLGGASLLTRLAMRDNRLTSVRGVKNHPKLQSLSLLNNSTLLNLPLEIGTCTALEVLEYDPTLRFPPPIITEKGLTATLEFLAEIFDSLPTHTVAVPSRQLPELGLPLCEESALSSLDISHNLLLSLPSSLSLLSSLRSLRASHNQISSLPPSLGLLPSLTALDLSFNHIRALPRAIGSLSSLSSLSLHANRLASLPLPFASLSLLSSLSLSSNPLSLPPPDVIAAGPQSVVRYLGGLRAMVLGHDVSVSGANLKYFPLFLVTKGVPLELIRTVTPPATAQAERGRGGEKSENGQREAGGGGGGGKKETLSSGEGGGEAGENEEEGEEGREGERERKKEWWTDRWMAVDEAKVVLVGKGVESLSLDGNQLRALPDVTSGQYLIRAEDGAEKLVRLGYGLNEICSLTYLSVRGNLLTEVPPSIAVLEHLRSLVLDNNLITAWNEDPGQPISSLSALTLLSLNTNELAGVPTAIGDLSSLETLSLDSNHVKVLPAFVTSLQALTALSLNDNAISELPPYIQALSHLRDLRFASNQISELPPELFRISTLTVLRASSNQLETLPKSISYLKNLSSLSLSHNALADLPPALASMPMLSHVSLHNNPKLPPTLPPGILDSDLSHLKSYLRRLNDTDKSLDLSGLALSVLPLNVFHNIHLQDLRLNDNRLATLPLQVTDLVRLRTLDLSNNQFIELPEGLLSLSYLADLKIKGNPLPDLHPQILAQGSSVVLEYLRRVRRSRLTKRLDLASLSLTSVPPHVLSLVFVEDLSFEGNQLQAVPEHLCWELPMLTRLNLRRNNLEAPLPLMLGRMSRLTALDLAQNKLTSFPVGIGKLSKLRFLGWGGNPVKLPPIALLGQGVPAVLETYGKLVEGGCGMSLSVFHRSVAPKKEKKEEKDEREEGGEEDKEEEEEEEEGEREERENAEETGNEDRATGGGGGGGEGGEREYAGTVGVDGTELGPYAKPPAYACVLIGEEQRRAMSLEEAMEQAKPNETVLLRPGKHVANLSFKNAGVTLAGDGTGEECCIEGKRESSKKAVITCLALNCRLYNLTIAYSGSSRETAAVFVSNGSLKIINCALSNMAGMGVWVRAGADVHITACRIQGCGGPGVMLESRVHAEIKFNDIVKCRGPGVKCVEGSNPLIEANRIVGGSACGVLSATKGLGVIRHNEIHQHKGAGVEIRSHANPVVEGNTLGNNLVGVLCAEMGCGKLLDNTMADNKKAGIMVTGSSQVECIANKIKGNKDSSGLVLREESKVVVREHEVHGVGHGIVVTEGARVRVESSRVIHVTKEAFRVTGAGSLLDANENQVFGNSQHGVHVLAGGEARLTNNEIYFNGGSGVLVDEDCTGSMSGNDVHDNAQGDVLSSSNERRFVIA